MYPPVEWSPDGSRGVFSHQSQVEACGATYTQTDLWTMAADGTDLAQLTDTGLLEGNETAPVWSPDGGSVAYASRVYRCEGSGREEAVVEEPADLFVAAADGSDPTRVLDPPGDYSGYAAAVLELSWQPCTSATTTCGRPDGTGGYPGQAGAEPDPEPSPEPDPDPDPDPDPSPEPPDAAPVARIEVPDVADAPIGLAVEVCRAALPDGGARQVLLARDDDFADALAGAPLAGADSCVLFTAGGEDALLDPGTRAEIERVLAPGQTVVVLGGERAVSVTVEDELLAAGYGTQRLAGESRFQTAVAVAEAVGGGGQVLLATGYDWADAVTGGAYGAAAGAPLVLTGADELHPDTAAYLEARPGTDVVALGGTAVIGDDVLAAAGARRVAGATRHGTAAAVATDLWGALAPGAADVVVANLGAVDGWTAALAAAPLSAQGLAPQVGVWEDTLPVETDAWLRASGVTGAVVLGDEGWVQQPVVDAVQAALGGA